MERDASSESHDSFGSVGEFGSVRMRDAGSQSNAEGNSNRVSHSYNFGPLTVTVRRIEEFTEQGYFDEGGVYAPGEETIAEPKNDEAVMFVYFFYWWS
jgi:hypothetical protein